MKKFWLWMNEKKYSNGCWIIRPSIKGFREQQIKEPTKQMLIGYMFEYIKSNHVHDGTIEDLYIDLLKEIEEISK
jgi:hypothetical protein